MRYNNLAHSIKLVSDTLMNPLTNVVHLNVVKESRVSEPQKPHKEHIPDHGWTVIRSVLTAVMVAILLWAGFNIDQSGNRLEVLNHSLNSIKESQERFLTEQKATHDAVLVMSATYASKEDLERQRQIFSEQLDKINNRLKELEMRRR